MKQYLNSDQTAKLIELGFEKPKNTIYKQVAKRKIGYGIIEWEDAGEEGSYSAVELIDMLPRTIKSYYDLCILSTSQGWWVLYGIIGDGDMWSIEYEVYRSELIDSLFAMAVKLKEEGVI